jgi:hypothetical protein
VLVGDLGLGYRELLREIAHSQENDNQRGFSQPWPRSPAGRDTATVVGVEGGAVPKGQEFAQAVIGIFLC